MSCSSGRALAVVLCLLVTAVPALASVESELAFHRGVEAYGAKRYDEARVEFEKVLAETPDDVATLRYLALIAQQQDDSARAIELYRKALATNASDPDLHFDLGTALLDAGQPAEALAEFEAVIAAQPDRARAHLLAGISRYRTEEYAAANQSFEKAIELDPGLTAEANYYRGLSQVYLGDYRAASGAFGVAEDQSPGSGMGRSAADLRGQIEPHVSEEKRWAASVTSGLEYDSNPRVVGQTFIPREDDGRNVNRLQASYRIFDTERFTLTTGYDGYLSFYFNQTDLDVQSHVPWVAASYRVDPVRFAVRYDFAYTFLDLTDSYQRLQRVTPSVYLNEGKWGVTELFYQYLHGNYLFKEYNPALDQDGPYQAVGLNQFLFPSGLARFGSTGQWLQYLRFGGLVETYDPTGTEFQSQGFELSFGFGLTLPWELTLTGEYRYVFQDYDNASVFDPGVVQEAHINVVSLELVRPITEHLEVSIYGFYRDNSSNVPTYDYNRVIAGTYLTYRF